MSFSIKQHFKFFAVQEQTELNRGFKALQADLDAHRAALVALTAKLDADVGITDTDYAATVDPVPNTVID